ncbi:MAG: hypothetical protein ACE5ED_01145 [Rhodothalassiaceae bacterium]
MAGKQRFAAAVIAAMLAGGLRFGPALAQEVDESAPIITPMPRRAYEVTLEVTLAAPPTEVRETITGDISGWWDHRFSGWPAAFFIDARPGCGTIYLPSALPAISRPAVAAVRPAPPSPDRTGSIVRRFRKRERGGPMASPFRTPVIGMDQSASWMFTAEKRPRRSSSRS